MTSHTTFLLPNPHTPVTLFLPKNLSTLKPRPKVTLLYSVERTREASANHLEQ